MRRSNEDPFTVLHNIAAIVEERKLLDWSRKLHEPEKIELWNPEAPINTFWDISSQVTA